MKKRIIFCISLILLLSCVLGTFSACRPIEEKPETPPTEGKPETPTEDPEGDKVTYPFAEKIDFVNINVNAATMGAKELSSMRGMIANLTTNEINACTNPSPKISPAGLTRIMTLVIIAEQIQTENTLKKLVTITDEQLEKSEPYGPAYLLPGEKATVKDLIYSMIMRQDAVATIALAEHLCGSHEAFVGLMNQKLEELDINEDRKEPSTHFSNATGAYSESHYSTVKDMTAIMLYAMKNSFCREVLGASQYTLSNKSDTGDGIIYNSFLSSDLNDGETQPDSVRIRAGLSAYSKEAGYCLASYATDADGNVFVSVTSNASSALNAVFDHFYLYNNFAHRSVGTEVGNLAPDLEIETYAGEKIKLSSLAGKVVVINFWGTWCVPCKSELPHFNEAAEAFAEDVVVITIHSNQDSDTAVEYMSKYFPDTKMIIAKDTRTDEHYKALDGSGAYPFTVILNDKGVITFSKGSALDYTALTGKIQDALSS